MIATVLIVGISLGLFVYWFRYTVILILRTQSSPDYAQRVAAANQLGFMVIRQQLHSRLPTQNMDGLCRDLRRDYKVLKYLLGHAAAVETGSYPVEQRLLMVNFQLLRAWFAVTLRLRPHSAKLALLEMSSTLEYFANAMGRRFATLAAETARS